MAEVGEEEKGVVWWSEKQQPLLVLLREKGGRRWMLGDGEVGVGDCGGREMRMIPLFLVQD